MGFWQGINAGLDAAQEQKNRKRELQARQDEIEKEREIRRQERKEDFAFDRERFQATLRETRLAPLQAKLMERALYDTEAEDVTHELSVLQGMGVSEEVLNSASTLNKETLQEAVAYAKEQQAKYAGTPLEFGPAGLDAYLSSAITTLKEGKAPNMAVAADMFGITEEELDAEYVGGMTYREAIAKALTQRPTQETTFIGNNAGKPLEETDIEAIRKGAEKSLMDALNQRTISISKATTDLNTRLSKGETLTQEEIDKKDSLEYELKQTVRAKEELDKGSVLSAINIVGGQSLIPYFMNNPSAMQYNFGLGWQEGVARYTFPDEEAAKRAAVAGRILPGDYVIVGGKAGRAR
jgi:hypothetical protein